MTDDQFGILYDERQLALSTLADSTALVSITKIDTSRLNGFRISKIRGWANLFGKTDGEGPIIFGFALSMDATAIKDTIDADPQSIIANGNYESKKPVFPLGMFPAQEAQCKPIYFDEKIKWTCPEGSGSAVFFVYNMGGDQGALTTGAKLETFVKIYGAWLRD